jgi:hypothetical protein
MLFSALAKNGYRLGQNLEYQPYGAAMQIALLPQLAASRQLRLSR